MSKKSDQAAESLRAFGLTYPEAHIKSPWPDHKDLAVKDKTFAYISVAGQPFFHQLQAATIRERCLGVAFCAPTGYGLGKSGWVTATIEKGDIPVALFKDWIDESYRAQAPKRLVRQLDE